MTDRELTALHESAHAVVRYRLDLPLGVVSIRRTASYLGVCGARGVNRITELNVEQPLLVLQPARPRRHVESTIRFTLAGPAADRLWFPSTGYVQEPRQVPLDALPSLPPLAAAELSAIEAHGNALAAGAGFIRDEDSAYSLSVVLVGPSLARAYYAWAEADTAAMVGESARYIERLAEELLIHDAMAPHAVRAVLRRSTP